MRPRRRRQGPGLWTSRPEFALRDNALRRMEVRNRGRLAGRNSGREWPGTAIVTFRYNPPEEGGGVSSSRGPWSSVRGGVIGIGPARILEDGSDCGRAGRGGAGAGVLARGIDRRWRALVHGVLARAIRTARRENFSARRAQLLAAVSKRSAAYSAARRALSEALAAAAAARSLSIIGLSGSGGSGALATASHARAAARAAFTRLSAPALIEPCPYLRRRLWRRRVFLPALPPCPGGRSGGGSRYGNAAAAVAPFSNGSSKPLPLPAGAYRAGRAAAQRGAAALRAIVARWSASPAGAPSSTARR